MRRRQSRAPCDGDAQGALQFVEEAVGRVAGQRQKIAAAGFQKTPILDERLEGRAVTSSQQKCRAVGDGRVVEGEGAHVILVAAGLGALDEPLQEVGRGRRSSAAEHAYQAPAHDAAFAQAASPSANGSSGEAEATCSSSLPEAVPFVR